MGPSDFKKPSPPGKRPYSSILFPDEASIKNRDKICIKLDAIRPQCECGVRIYAPMPDVLVASPDVIYPMSGNEIPVLSSVGGRSNDLACRIGVAYGDGPNAVVVVDLVNDILYRIRDDLYSKRFRRLCAARALDSIERIVQGGSFVDESQFSGITFSNKGVYFEVEFNNKVIEGKPGLTDEERILWALYRLQEAIGNQDRIRVVSDNVQIRIKAMKMGLLAEGCRYESVEDHRLVYAPPKKIVAPPALFSVLSSEGRVSLEAVCEANGHNAISYHSNSLVEVHQELDKPGPILFTLMQDGFLRASRYSGLSFAKELIVGYPRQQENADLSFSGSGIFSIPVNPDIEYAPKQMAYMDLLLDPSLLVVSAVGPSGAGKSECALLAGLMTTADRLHSQVIYTRIQPEDRQDRPDDQSDICPVWARSARQDLRRIFRNRQSPDPIAHRDEVNQHVDFLKERGVIDYVHQDDLPNLVEDAFWIVDGAHYSTREEMKDIIYRAGSNTKLVLLGDPSKIIEGWNSSITVSNCGLTHVIDRLIGDRQYACVTFLPEDVVKGPGARPARLVWYA